MTYLVNCRDCDFIAVNDTDFDTGNAATVKDQHRHGTWDGERAHTVVTTHIYSEMAEEALEKHVSFPPQVDQ